MYIALPKNMNVCTQEPPPSFATDTVSLTKSVVSFGRSLVLQRKKGGLGLLRVQHFVCI